MSRTHIVGGAFASGGTLLLARTSGIANVSDNHVLIGTLIGMFASEFPDIDHAESRVSRGGGSLYRFLPFGMLMSVIASFPARILGMFVREKWNHRGPTHSLFFAAVWAVIATPLYAVFLFLITLVAVGILRPLVAPFLLPLARVVGNETWLTIPAMTSSKYVAMLVVENSWLIAISVLAGYVSHLVLDGVTKVPVPFLWPVKKQRMSLLPRELQIATDSTTERHAVRPLLLVATICSVGIFSVFPLAQRVLRGTSGIGPAKLENDKRSSFSQEETKLCQRPSHHHRMQKSPLCKKGLNQ